MMSKWDAQRAMDLTLATPVFIASLPVQAVIAGLVKLRLGSPVLFAQERPGLHGKTFTMHKFRSMHSVDPDRGRVTDEQRLTRFGRLLRASSLDELPTLWNIVRGDMSIVGPRPLLVAYLDLYSPQQARRHDVRPGLTGLAQVSGRNALTWEERFALDIDYVDTRSLTLDLRIIARTFATVFRRVGITDADGVTMSEFTGSDSHVRPQENIS